MSEEITTDQLRKLAQDMVAASSLQSLYGISPFLKAKAAFEERLEVFEKQVKQRQPIGTVDVKIGGQNPPAPQFINSIDIAKR